MMGALSGVLIATVFVVSPQEPKTATIQLPEGHRVTDSLMVDVDGDSNKDLVLACLNTKTWQRSLRVYQRQTRGPAFNSTPSKPPIQVDRDVVAFTYCDCNPSPGKELLLLTPEQVVLVTPDEEGRPSYTRLMRHQLVWPAADNQRVVALKDSATDIDADGLSDLLLPRPDGWTVWFQDRTKDSTSFTRKAERSVPAWQNALEKAMGKGGATIGEDSWQLRFSTSSQFARTGPLVRIATRTPQCQQIDFDGNGMLDLLMYRNGFIYAALQSSKGKLSDQNLALPLPPNRLTVLDPAFNLQWTDINKNGMADLLLTTSAQRDDEIETRVDLFRTSKEGTWSAKPTVRLRMQTLATKPQIVDADGDGRDDLVCVTLRTGSMPTIPTAQSSSFECLFSIYRNDDDQFQTPALIARPLSLITNSQFSKPFLVVRPGRRGRAGDVVMHIGGHLERRFLNRKAGRLTLSKADARTPVPKKARILAADPIADEILIVTNNEVRHVRFRR
jgi:hypothetical protein